MCFCKHINLNGAFNYFRFDWLHAFHIFCFYFLLRCAVFVGLRSLENSPAAAWGEVAAKVVASVTLTDHTDRAVCNFRPMQDSDCRMMHRLMGHPAAHRLWTGGEGTLFKILIGHVTA